MSPPYRVFGAARGEITAEQVRRRGVGWFGDGGAVPAAQPHTFDVVLAHDPSDPFVIDPFAGGLSVIDLGGDSGPPVSVVVGVDGMNLLGEFDIGGGAGGSCVGGAYPHVVRRTSDIDDLAQPLHRVGVGVVGDEVKAVHQFVSPAKYLAADRRMSRSVSSFVFSARRCATSARSRAASRSTVSPGSGLGALLLPGLRIEVPAFLSHVVREPCAIPRSAAIPATVAPSVSRYSWTASQRNSSV